MSEHGDFLSRRGGYIAAVRAIGLDAVGFVPAGDTLTFDAYAAAVSGEVPPQLGYLVKNCACRRDFESILPGAKTVLCAACAFPDLPALTISGGFARFCAIGDYHAVMRARLEALREYLSAHFELGNCRICVDSAPVLERELAVRAGLGTIGFNRQVIHPVLGSQIALSELFVEADLSEFKEELSVNASACDLRGLVPGQASGCCRSGARCCVRACPTGALSENGYDFSKCLSYWTTQHRGEIPEIYARAVTSLWGCDRCQNACPRARNRSQTPVSAAETPLASLSYDEILTLSGRALKKRLAGSPLADAQPYMLVRNACIVIGNRRLIQYFDPAEKIAQSHGCDWVRQSAVRACRLLENG